MSPLGVTQNALRVGQIAKHCEVNPRTVHRWIKDGKLKSFVLPSGHFRVNQNDFRRFLRLYDFPLISSELDFSQQIVLVVDDDDKRVETLRNFFFTEVPQLQFQQVRSLVAASLAIGLSKPQLLFISFAFDPRQFQRFCNKLKERAVAKKSLIYFVMDRGSSFDLPRSLKSQASMIEIPFEAKALKNQIKEFIYDE